MASSPPKKNAQHVFYIGLIDQADPSSFKANPTLATGDFKVSTDGGSFANLATLPVVTPAVGKAVKVTLSAGEMNGDDIVVVASDVAGAEWVDQLIYVRTVSAQMDDIAANVRNTVMESAGSYTLQQAVSIILAAVAGRTIDGGRTFKTPDGSLTRIAGTVNGANERTGITLTPSS